MTSAENLVDRPAVPRLPRSMVCIAALLLTLLVANHVSAYTFEYCKAYADRVVQESTSAALSNAMRGTTSDTGLSGLTGSGSYNDPNSLSGVLGSLSESQDQQSLWQRTFNHCMGVSR